jgi:hypothetical protein
MLDLTYIQNQSDYVQVFYNNGTGGTNGGQPSSSSWQTWTKPRNKCNFVWMMCMSGGAGGNGGFSYGSTGTGGGGFGGASAAITTVLFPANLLPDTLFIWVGKGGAGGLGTNSGTTSTPGLTGGKSLVAVRPVTSSIYTFPGSSELLCSSGRGEWNGTQTGEAGNGDSGIVLPKLITLGIWNSVNGRDRVSQSPFNVTPLIGGTITCPGADGGNATPTTPTAGSSILLANIGSNIISPTISGAPFNTQTPGQSGYWSWKPMFGTGGAGGGANGMAGIGGKGGNGAYGCGGGGGGYGSTTGGSGGNGGDGLVIIATF